MEIHAWNNIEYVLVGCYFNSERARLISSLGSNYFFNAQVCPYGSSGAIA